MGGAVMDDRIEAMLQQHEVERFYFDGRLFSTSAVSTIGSRCWRPTSTTGCRFDAP